CGKPVSEYQVQQDEQDTLAKEIDEGALYEAERADALHFSQLESQYLESVLIKALYFLICQTETLHQLDISQRFRGAAGQRIGLGRNGALDTLDLPAEDAGQHGQQDHAQYIYRHDRPVQRERINGYEDDADDDRKKHIDKGNDEPFRIETHLRQDRQGLAAALVLEIAEGQSHGVPKAGGEDGRAEPLHDDVAEIVLECLGDAGDHGHADLYPKKCDRCPDELRLGPRPLAYPHFILV